MVSIYMNETLIVEHSMFVNWNRQLEEAKILKGIDYFCNPQKDHIIITTKYNSTTGRIYALKVYVNFNPVFEWFSCFSIYDLKTAYQEFIRSSGRRKIAS